VAGIAGTIGQKNGIVDTILTKMDYRGPHESWKCQDGDVTIGCNELNVRGTVKEGSHHASNGKKAVVLDGRIYNAETTGMTDAEAVLDVYSRYGVRFAENLDGDFACIIAVDGRIIAARDRIGIKPLYFGHASDGTLVFASEAKALLGISFDVKEFPAGYTYSPELGFQRFIKNAVDTPECETYDEAKKTVRTLLEEAVEKRMKDQAVDGVLLSGGLDSSLIAFMAAQINPNIECYTVSMEEGEDLPLARDVTEYLGLKHHILKFGEDEIRDILPTAIYHQEMYEESCVHGAIANFLAARFIAGHGGCCVLTGEGADEFFAGYDGQYKQGMNAEERAFIIDNLIAVAHNTALQRLDRLNAANSIESRTPFLDAKVFDFSQKIPLSFKLHGEEFNGKWIVRQAFEGCLPDHIIYQTKRFFAQGSGVASIMRAQAEQAVTEEELAAFNASADNPYLTSVEELYYYRIFKKTFNHPVFDRLVGRWDPVRPDFFLRRMGT